MTDVKTFEKVAAYIEMTQPVIDKYNENRMLFVKKANQVAGVLANRGIIAHDKVNAFVDKVAGDESGVEVWNLVEKLAEVVSSDTLGEASQLVVKVAKLDPFEKLALYGDPRAETKIPGVIN